jgi:hypothetical protein
VGKMKKVYLVGFDFAKMDEVIKKMSGGYYEKGQFIDRIKGIEANDVSEAVEKYLEKLKNWITDYEKKFVIVMDTASIEEWQNDYYRSEYAWLRKIGIM